MRKVQRSTLCQGVEYKHTRNGRLLINLSRRYDLLCIEIYSCVFRTGYQLTTGAEHVGMMETQQA